MKKPKSKWDRFSTLLFVGVIGFFLYQRLPGWIANTKVEGQVVPPFSVSQENGETLSLPLSGKKQVILFWATWCGPCTVELARFNSAVKDGDLKAEDIIAISFGEEPQIVWAEAKKRDYRFVVAADPDFQSQKSLEVYGTPQTYHVDEDKKITHASMGLGLFSIWRAQYFLADKT